MIQLLWVNYMNSNWGILNEETYLEKLHKVNEIIDINNDYLAKFSDCHSFYQMYKDMKMAILEMLSGKYEYPSSLVDFFVREGKDYFAFNFVTKCDVDFINSDDSRDIANLKIVTCYAPYSLNKIYFMTIEESFHYDEDLDKDIIYEEGVKYFYDEYGVKDEVHLKTDKANPNYLDIYLLASSDIEKENNKRKLVSKIK